MIVKIGLYGDQHTNIDPTFVTPVDAPEGTPAVTKHARANTVTTDADIRCAGQVPIRSEPGEFRTCHKLLAKLAGRPWVIECPRCKTTNRSPSSSQSTNLG